MKSRVSHASFIENLRRKIESIRRLKPQDVHVFTVNTNYGHYQIIVGPRKKNNERDLEIKGEIHHLFVSSGAINPNPSKRQIKDNLKDTVIVRDLEIDLHDSNGEGRKVETKNSRSNPREYINMAGKKGELLVRNLKSGNRLLTSAYKIIQKDILHSIEKEK